MSSRDDATLSSREREAFERIKTQAIAADPTLGASAGRRLWLRLRRGVPALGRLAEAAWVGPVALALGIVAMAVGLATTTVLAVFGLVLVVGGGVGVARRVRRRFERRPSTR